MPAFEPRPDILLLTVNQRLARELGAAYAARQQAKGLTVWETPLILSWNAWLARVWEEVTAAVLEQPGHAPPVLLNPAQERAVWEQIIAESAQGKDLLQTAATARYARSAWESLCHWELRLPTDELELNEDNKAFAAWASAFSALCRQRGWLEPARLAPALAEYFSQGLLPVPSRVQLAGFDELAPQQKSLLGALREAGARLEEWPLERESQPRALRIAAPDAEEEIRLAARWARGLLENAAPADTGDKAWIGVVIPQLEKTRGQVARIFDEIFYLGQGRRLYNISLGRPLSEYPLIHDALDMLSLIRQKSPLEQAGGLLRSPFWLGAEAEFERRALFDAWLREHAPAELDAKQLLRQLQRSVKAGDNPAHACPVLQAALETWWAACLELPVQQTPGAWAESFARLLGLLGWPDRGRSLDSEEYQTVAAWRALLSQFASLDAVWNRMSLPRALGQLRRMAGEQIFQPQSESAPVQILGELEATGLRFQALWLLGLHDEAWPPPSRPNPFLPLKLQRRHNLPRSSAEREWQVAARITESLRHAAPRVVMSWPRFDGERELRPSPLLREVPDGAPAELALAEDNSYWRTQFDRRALERFPDRRGPILSGEHTRGGSALFQRQSACPFRAFAEFRLFARPLGSPRGGLDAALRGQLVHRALEQVWRVLRSSTALQRLGESELHTLIAEQVAQVVAETARQRFFGARFCALEQARLLRLLARWLEWEKQRAPFEVVALEHSAALQVGALEITAKLDRLDELAGGGKVLIDYKTSNSQNLGPQRWEGERPDEPQLPLYSLPLAGQLAAVLFAQLQPRRVRFAGIAREDGTIPGVKAFAGDWDGNLRNWAEVLQRLGEAFRQGHAEVAPKKPDTCRDCPLPALCRIAWAGGEEME